MRSGVRDPEASLSARARTLDAGASGFLRLTAREGGKIMLFHFIIWKSDFVMSDFISIFVETTVAVMSTYINPFVDFGFKYIFGAPSSGEFLIDFLN